MTKTLGQSRRWATEFTKTDPWRWTDMPMAARSWPTETCATERAITWKRSDYNTRADEFDRSSRVLFVNLQQWRTRRCLLTTSLQWTEQWIIGVGRALENLLLLCPTRFFKKWGFTGTVVVYYYYVSYILLIITTTILYRFSLYLIGPGTHSTGCGSGVFCNLERNGNPLCSRSISI